MQKQRWLGECWEKMIFSKKKGLKAKALSPCFYYGSPSWTRTNDKRINSPLLYQLSYRGSVV